MLTLYTSFLLGLIQGVGEFLPISSSAHLAIAEIFLNISSSHRTLEISLHLGTLLAVVVYFFKTFWKMVADSFLLIGKKQATQETKWLGQIILATLPSIIFGLAVHSFFPNIENTLGLIGIMSILAGLALYTIDKKAKQKLTLTSLTARNALFIGLFQCVALIPGASRLGMTLLGARLLGYKRSDALIFSYWLSVPVVLGAVTLNTFKIIKEKSFDLNLTLVFGIFVSFIIGLSTIHFFIKWLKHSTLGPLMVYRVLFGFCLIVYVLTS